MTGQYVKPIIVASFEIVTDSPTIHDRLNRIAKQQFSYNIGQISLLVPN
jgi:hypothetical protein